MRKLVPALGMLVALAAASPSWASFTGSLYYSNFVDHHVRRLDIAGNVPGATTDLVTLPGADGILLDPYNANKLLVGGQLTGNVYRTPTTGGSFTTVNAGGPAGTLTYGALHMAILEPTFIGTGVQGVLENQLLCTGYESPVAKNHIGALGLTTGLVLDHNIAGTDGNAVAGIAVRKSTGAVYVADGLEPGVGGQLYSVNLLTNLATKINVQTNGNLFSHDLHGLWIDKLTGHLFGGGAKHVEEIDLDAIGGPKMVNDWDLSALIPESPGSNGHIDQIASDDFGNLFAASNSGEILYLDLTAGSPSWSLTKKVADVNLDDIAVGPSAVPEPSTLLLAGLGLVGVAALRKRMS